MRARGPLGIESMRLEPFPPCLVIAACTALHIKASSGICFCPNSLKLSSLNTIAAIVPAVLKIHLETPQSFYSLVSSNQIFPLDHGRLI